jgi:D-glycero-alpha-D-manno-heptose-7-phosphate kinase
MIITRTPFRVSFLGGGTDLPWFFEEETGAVISTAIDKYMYLSAHPLFSSENILLKYSTTEFVTRPQDLKHPIAREVLSREQINGIDISVTADVPSGSGLGSSSAFTVGMEHLVAAYKNKFASQQELAMRACNIEIDILKEPIGKQDQYASAFGGLNLYVFQKDGTVDVRPLNLSPDNWDFLANSMVLVRIGNGSRSASKILSEQAQNSKKGTDQFNALKDLRDLTIDSFSTLSNDIRELPSLLNQSWELKKLSNPETSNKEIDELIARGKSLGASGSKLLGAGSSGFVLFMVEPEIRQDFINRLTGRNCLIVRPDRTGSTVIYSK